MEETPTPPSGTARAEPVGPVLNALDFDSPLFDELKPFDPPDTRRIVGLKLRSATRLLDAEAGDVSFRVGDYAVVELRGVHRVAEVVRGNRAYLHNREPLPKVIRKATDDDLERAARLSRREADAFVVGVELIHERKLPFKLLGVEWHPDGSRAAFYFCSEDKVEIKDFVYEMGARLHTRVEMRQVGIRDGAGHVGGIGDCGRELCCSSWLRGFKPISIKMAKNQGLALDNEKLTGQCGRLKCCLAYEDDTYRLALKSLPKRGFKFEVEGRRYTVISTNPLLQKALVLDPEGVQHLLEVETLNAVLKKPEVNCLSKVNFMDPEAARRAEEMAGQVSLDVLSSVPVIDAGGRGISSGGVEPAGGLPVAVAGGDQADDLAAMLRETAPEDAREQIAQAERQQQQREQRRPSPRQGQQDRRDRGRRRGRGGDRGGRQAAGPQGSSQPPQERDRRAAPPEGAAGQAQDNRGGQDRSGGRRRRRRRGGRGKPGGEG